MRTDASKSGLSRGSDERPAAQAPTPRQRFAQHRRLRGCGPPGLSRLQSDPGRPTQLLLPQHVLRRQTRTAPPAPHGSAPARPPHGPAARRGPLRGSRGFPGLGGGKGGARRCRPSRGPGAASPPPPGNRCGRGSALCAGAGEARAVRAPTAVTLFTLAVNSLRVPPPSPSPHS